MVGRRVSKQAGRSCFQAGTPRLPPEPDRGINLQRRCVSLFVSASPPPTLPSRRRHLHRGDYDCALSLWPARTTSSTVFATARLLTTQHFNITRRFPTDWTCGSNEAVTFNARDIMKFGTRSDVALFKTIETSRVVDLSLSADLGYLR